jgi:hypothetical protein
MGTLIDPPPMRALLANAERLRRAMQKEIARKAELERDLPTLPLTDQLYHLSSQAIYDQDYLRDAYALGVALDTIRDEALARHRAMLQGHAFVRENGGALYTGISPLDATIRPSYAYAALALLLVDDKAVSASFHELMPTTKEKQNYLLALLVKAFDPAQPVAKKYKPNKYASPWTDPIVRALALPAPERPAALARHMDNWTRLMRPYGWKPDLDTASGKETFADFAFEVALAVCGWDIDDSSFADHPYYPRDLVAWYRERVRQARDAWRAPQSGAGVDIAPPSLVRTDLAKTKRKGIARWVELVADGDQDATEAVLETVGKPRRIKDLDELLATLGDAGIALNADIKDDATLALQMDAMSAARGLGEFAGPASPQAGPARCTALLRAWDSWLAERAYRLVAIDNQDDAWNAVVVADAWRDELRALGAELAIPLCEPATLYAD